MQRGVEIDVNLFAGYSDFGIVHSSDIFLISVGDLGGVAGRLTFFKVEHMQQKVYVLLFLLIN